MTQLAESVQSGAVNTGVDIGSVNAYSVVLNPVPPQIEVGFSVWFKVVNSNTGASTLDVNGTTKNICLPGGTTASFPGGALIAGMVAEFVYDGTNFEMVSSRATASPTAVTRMVYIANHTDNVTLTTTASEIGAWVRMWGAGGGGGGSNGAGAYGGGGGGGEYAEGFLSLSPNTGYVLTAGTGGTAGASSPTGGGAGSASSFASLLTAGAGAGGDGQSGGGAATPGAAGSGGTGGSVHITGGSGGQAVPAVALQGAGGPAGLGSAVSLIFNASSVGNAAFGPGGGGAGGSGTNVGAVGNDGMIVVMMFSR